MGNQICNNEKETNKIKSERYDNSFNQQSSYIVSSQLENGKTKQNNNKKKKKEKDQAAKITQQNGLQLDSSISFQSADYIQRDSSKNPYLNQQALQSELYHKKTQNLETINELNPSQELKNNQNKNQDINKNSRDIVIQQKEIKSETFGGNALDLIGQSLILNQEEIKQIDYNNEKLDDNQCIYLANQNISQFFMINMENNLEGYQQITHSEDSTHKLQIFAKTYVNQDQNRIIQMKGEYFLPGSVFGIIELFEDFDKIMELDKKIVQYQKQLLQSYFSQYNIPQSEEHDKNMQKIQQKLDQLQDENDKIIGQINETQMIKKIVQQIMFSVPREFNYVRKIKCMDILKGIVTEGCESVQHQDQENQQSENSQEKQNTTSDNNQNGVQQNQSQSQAQNQAQNQNQTQNQTQNSSAFRNQNNQEHVQGQIIKQCQTYIPAHLLYGDSFKNLVLVRFYSEIDYQAHLEEQLYINTNCQEMKNQVERWFLHLQNKINNEKQQHDDDDVSQAGNLEQQGQNQQYVNQIQEFQQVQEQNKDEDNQENQ